MTEEKEVVAAEQSNGQENDKENNMDEETDLDKAIIRQMEYYFSKSNLMFV